MLNLQSWDWVVIFLIVLLIFGGRKIPEIGRSLGRGIREFKKAKDGVAASIEGADDELKETPAAPLKKDADGGA